MKTLATLLALTLILGIFPAWGGTEEAPAGPDEVAETAQVEAAEAAAGPDENAEPAEDAEAAEGPPPFTLSTQENDGPKVARLKAALRLLKHAQATIVVLKGCAAVPSAGKALEEFMGRNGKTLALVLNVIKESGGQTPEIKAVMDQEVAAERAALVQEVDCLIFADRVTKNTRDIYKAHDLAKDYQFIKSGPGKK